LRKITSPDVTFSRCNIKNSHLLILGKHKIFLGTTPRNFLAKYYKQMISMIQVKILITNMDE
jgi:hypothetical protein